MNFPAELKYSKSHEWVRMDGEIAVVGISDFAQDALGDVVFINLPTEGDAVTAGESFGDVESVKAVSDIISPVSGTICAVNEALADAPETLNSDPYGAWIIKVSPVTDTEELSASELQLRPVLRSHCDGQPGSADESLTLRLHSAHTRRYLFSNALYIASVSPLNLYSRNAPFSGKHWLLVGSVPAVQLFAFAQRLQQRLLLTAQVDAERDLRKRLFAAVEHHRGRLRMKSGYGPFVLRAENGRTLQYAERIALGGSGGGQQRQYRQEKGLHHRQIDFSNNTIDSLSSTQVIAAGI